MPHQLPTGKNVNVLPIFLPRDRKTRQSRLADRKVEEKDQSLILSLIPLARARTNKGMVEEAYCHFGEDVWDDAVNLLGVAGICYDLGYLPPTFSPKKRVVFDEAYLQSVQKDQAYRAKYPEQASQQLTVTLIGFGLGGLAGGLMGNFIGGGAVGWGILSGIALGTGIAVGLGMLVSAVHYHYFTPDTVLKFIDVSKTNTQGLDGVNAKDLSTRYYSHHSCVLQTTHNSYPQQVGAAYCV